MGINLRDDDSFYVIDPNTRLITKESGGKDEVVQYDDNSEVFTFKVPHRPEGIDLYGKTERIEIHYVNTSSGTSASNRTSNEDVYIVKDIEKVLATPNEKEHLRFTWTLSQNGTQLAGTIKFQIHFVRDGDPESEENDSFRWSTKVYSAIDVSEGLNCTELVLEKNPDIIASFEKKIADIIAHDVHKHSNKDLLDSLSYDLTKETIAFGPDKTELATEEFVRNSVQGSVLGDDVVETKHIKDNAVTTAKINNEAVTSDKLARQSVTSDKIQGLAVKTEHIGSKAVTSTKIAHDSVGVHHFSSVNFTNGSGANAVVLNNNTVSTTNPSGMPTVANQARGAHATAMGFETEASGFGATSMGYRTIALSNSQIARGKYNLEDTDNKYADIVGNGEGGSNRSNAHTLDWDGNGWFAGDVYVHDLDENGDYVTKLATEDFVTDKTQGLATEAFATEKANEKFIVHKPIEDIDVPPIKDGDVVVQQWDDLQEFIFAENISIYKISDLPSSIDEINRYINGLDHSDEMWPMEDGACERVYFGHNSIFTGVWGHCMVFFVDDSDVGSPHNIAIQYEGEEPWIIIENIIFPEAGIYVTTTYGEVWDTKTIYFKSRTTLDPTYLPEIEGMATEDFVNNALNNFKALPEVSQESNEGQFLRVVNGQWAAASIPIAENNEEGY